MKAATGELNLTVVVFVAIGAIMLFFAAFSKTMFGDVSDSICCLASGGSFSNGVCQFANPKNQSSYRDCVTSSGYTKTSRSGSVSKTNKDFLTSTGVSNGSVSSNTKDLGVQKSINKALSISSNADTSKDDKDNKQLNTSSKSTVSSLAKNTSGGAKEAASENASNNKGEGTSNAVVSSGKVSGNTEQEIKENASKGISTVGDYRKSRITSTTSSYSEDKSTYTTTSTVKSNTSNYQMQVTSTYKKNKEGKYVLTEMSWTETRSSSSISDGYVTTVKGENGKDVKASYNQALKDQYNTTKINKYIEENKEVIYQGLNGQVVFLNTYGSDNTIVENANGTILSPGVVVTTWNYIKKSIINGNKIIVINSLGETYDLDGVISINTDLDLAFLKLKNQVGSKSTLGNVYDVSVESVDFTICTGEDYTLEMKFGYLLKRGGLITSAITLERNEEGSPLYSHKKELIGINNADVLKSSTSLARSTNYIKSLQNRLDKQDFSAIEYTKFKDLKEKYINENSEVEDNTIPKKVWNKYKRIGDIENTISLSLIKSSYDNGIVSLRYINDIKKYSDNFSLAKDFIIKLEKQGYKKKHSSTYKIIYGKGNKRVILLSEFNYLIIIMMGE